MGDAENPFAAPKVDHDVEREVQAPPKVPMPSGLKLVLVLLSIATLGALIPSLTAPSTGTLISTAVSLAIIIGLVRGSALAWKMSRIMGAIIGGLFLFNAAMAMRSVPAGAGLVALTGIFYMSPVFFLGAMPVREFYRVRCPECRGTSVKERNLLFTRKVCQNCGVQWRT